MHSGMKKKGLFSAIVLLAVIMVLSAFITGCSNSAKTSSAPAGNKTAKNSGSNGGKQIVLQFWTINLKKNFKDYINGLISSYEKKNPNVKIKWVDVPGGTEMTKKIITSLSGGNVPDVVNGTTDGIAQIQSYGAIAPISDLVGKNALNPYINGLVKGLTYNNKVMAIPWYYAGPPIGLIQTKVYKEAGLDPNKPAKTWKQLFQYGKIIHQKLPQVYGSNGLPQMPVFVSMGLPILNKDKTKAVFNSPADVKFVEMFKKAYQDGAIAPGAISFSKSGTQQNIGNGSTAQAGWLPGFALNNIIKNAPKVVPELKVVPPVMGKTGKVAIAQINALYVPKKSKHPKAAAKFALYVTNAKNQLAFCKLVPIFPSTKATLKDPFFSNIKVKSIQDAARKMMVKTAPNLVLQNLSIPGGPAALEQYYLNQIQAAFLGKITVKQALDKSVAYWNQQLKKVHH